MSNEQLVKADEHALSVFSSNDSFELAQRGAKLLAASDLVPQQFRGNVANCVIALNIAQRLRADPFAVLQALYIVHGRPAWSAQFLIGMVNTSRRFTPLQFDISGEGDAKTCVAHAKHLATGERVEGPPVSIEMAKKEGWYGKNGSKWQTMPDLMLRYRAGSFFARIYAPDLTMGIRTMEEALDVDERVERDVTQNLPSVWLGGDAGATGSWTVTSDSVEVEQEEPAAAPDAQDEQEEPQRRKGELLSQIVGNTIKEGLTQGDIEEALRDLELLGNGTLPRLGDQKLEEVLSRWPEVSAAAQGHAGKRREQEAAPAPKQPEHGNDALVLGEEGGAK